MRGIIVLSCAASLMGIGAAQADEGILPDGLYLRVEGGLASPIKPRIRDINASNGTFLSGDSHDATPGRLDKMTGSALWGGGIGYSILPALRVEAIVNYAGGYSLKGQDGHPANALLNDPGNVTASTGHINAYSVLANLAYDPPFQIGPLQPFVNLGLGVAEVSGDALRLTYQGANVSYGGQSSTNFAYRVGLGFSYEVLPHQVIELAYQFEDDGDIRYPAQKVFNASVGLPVTTSGLHGSLQSNQVLLGLRFHF